MTEPAGAGPPKRVFVDGDLDRLSVVEVGDRIMEAAAAGDDVILFVTAEGFIDSAGIAMLGSTVRLLRERGQELRLAVPQGSIGRRAVELSEIEIPLEG